MLHRLVRFHILWNTQARILSPLPVSTFYSVLILALCKLKLPLNTDETPYHLGRLYCNSQINYRQLITFTRYTVLVQPLVDADRAIKKDHHTSMYTYSRLGTPSATGTPKVDHV